MTTCACCTPVRVSQNVHSMTSPWKHKLSARWSIKCWNSPKARDLCCLHPWSWSVKANMCNYWIAYARRDLFARASMVKSTSWMNHRNSICARSTPSKSWLTVLKCAKICACAWRNLSRRPCDWLKVSPLLTGWIKQKRRHYFFLPASPAHIAVMLYRNSSHGCSHLIARLELALNAMVWVSSRVLMLTAWWRILNCR